MLYVKDAINRIDQFVQELTNTMPAISTEVAGVFVVAKLQQIKKSGVGQYSSKVYSPNFLKGKELSSSGRSFLDQKIKAKQNTNWKEFRGAQGLQNSFVDLYYSGQMLNTTGIERNNTVSFRYYSIIGARNDEAKKKMFMNMKRYGRFLTPTIEQEKQIGTRAIFMVGVIYKRILKTI